MLFREKYERARQIQREQRGLDIKEYEEYNGEKLYEPEMKDMIEKGDMFALMLSGLITILPVAALILFILIIISLIFFRIL